MSADYTQEKLWQAVDILVGRCTIQERLKNAAMYLIRLKGFKDDLAFPGDLDAQTRLDHIIGRLTSVPTTGNEGTIEASTRALSDDEGQELSREIFSLYCRATELASML
ncbi:MAG: hypothetical protein OYK82_05710 [Gammaproteobacteria bacterium]|nr:hypothetical protein [Gammaproteobacteria bacterium]